MRSPLSPHQSQPQTQSEAQSSNTSIIRFVCLVVFLDAVGISLVIPVMPTLITTLSDVSLSRAASVSGQLLFTYALIRFFASPLLGALSDRFGRRPVLLMALGGYATDYFIMALAPTLGFLFVARLISGMFGATYTAAHAAIADLSDSGSRARRFGIAGAAAGIGFVVGPVIGGILGDISPRLPFFAAGMLAALTCAYGYFRFPETLAVENRRQFSLARANPVGSLWIAARSRLVLFSLGAALFIYLANQSYVVIWSFFTMALLSWNTLSIGISIAVYGLSMAVVQGLLTGPVTKKVGEKAAISFSLTIGVMTYVGLAMAQSGWQVYALILLGSLSGFAFPALQALMTNHTPSDQQGELQGAVACMYSISAIISPIMMSEIFRLSTDEIGDYWPGAPFLVAAALIVTSGILFGIAITGGLKSGKPS